MGIPDSGKVTLTVSTIILVLAFFAVALRFWVRWITKVGISSDDWWILIGISLSMITGSTLLYGK